VNARATGATVRDFMTSPVTTISPHTGLKEAATLLRSGGFSALPVVDAQGRVIGVLSEADLLVQTEGPAPAAGAHRPDILACHLMGRPATTVRADAPLGEAAHLMHRQGVRRLPVVDDDGRPVGIVSCGDLLEVFLRSDEEIRLDVVRWLRTTGMPDVEVAVEDGVVMLNRWPASAEQRAIEVVRAVDGVVTVDIVPAVEPR